MCDTNLMANCGEMAGKWSVCSVCACARLPVDKVSIIWYIITRVACDEPMFGKWKRQTTHTETERQREGEKDIQPHGIIRGGRSTLSSCRSIATRCRQISARHNVRQLMDRRLWIYSAYIRYATIMGLCVCIPAFQPAVSLASILVYRNRCIFRLMV